MANENVLVSLGTLQEHDELLKAEMDKTAAAELNRQFDKMLESGEYTVKHSHENSVFHESQKGFEQGIYLYDGSGEFVASRITTIAHVLSSDQAAVRIRLYMGTENVFDYNYSLLFEEYNGALGLILPTAFEAYIPPDTIAPALLTLYKSVNTIEHDFNYLAANNPTTFTEITDDSGVSICTETVSLKGLEVVQDTGDGYHDQLERTFTATRVSQISADGNTIIETTTIGDLDPTYRKWTIDPETGVVTSEFPETAPTL